MMRLNSAVSKTVVDQAEVRGSIPNKNVEKEPVHEIFYPVPDALYRSEPHVKPHLFVPQYRLCRH